MLPRLVIASVVLLVACAPDGSGVRTVEPIEPPPLETVAPTSTLAAIDAEAARPEVVEPRQLSTGLSPTVAGRSIDLVAGEATTPEPATVAVIGDSLTQSAVDEIDAALSEVGIEVLAIDGVENRRMTVNGDGVPSGERAITAVLDSQQPELWVIALGTNDVGTNTDIAAFTQEVTTLLSLLPPDAPVIWVDLWIRSRVEEVTAANEAIRSVLRRRVGVSAVVDWFGHGEDPDIITSDGVHLTDKGQLLFADLIAVAIEDTFAG